MDLLPDLRSVRADLEHVAVREDEGVRGLDPQIHRESRVTDEHPVLAVDREKVLGAEDVQEELQLFLARMPGHVRPSRRVVDDLGAELEEVINGARDELLVPGDRRPTTAQRQWAASTALRQRSGPPLLRGR